MPHKETSLAFKQPVYQSQLMGKVCSLCNKDTGLAIQQAIYWSQINGVILPVYEKRVSGLLSHSKWQCCQLQKRGLGLREDINRPKIQSLGPYFRIRGEAPPKNVWAWKQIFGPNFKYFTKIPNLLRLLIQISSSINIWIEN